MKEIGKLTRVANIREVWAGEESEFTPWLARSENLSVLADALGLGPDGLDLIGTEVPLPSGGYHADILAKVTGSSEGDIVLVENQFGKSDHDHLGKLLTYSSGLKARTVVLIGEKIREEHRAAIDWLNAISNEDHAFFACEIELWQINGSLPAPKFNVVVEPNDWRREGTVAPEINETKLRLLRFWQVFVDQLGQTSKRVRPVKPLPQVWLTHGIGRSGCNLNAAVKFSENSVRCELYISGPNSAVYFQQLFAQRNEIESALGTKLNWNESSHILSLKHIVPALADPAQWKIASLWLAETLDKFHMVLSGRVKALKTGADGFEGWPDGGAAP